MLIIVLCVSTCCIGLVVGFLTGAYWSGKYIARKMLANGYSPRFVDALSEVVKA